MDIEEKALKRMISWRKDLNKFCYEVFKVRLDKVQHEKMGVVVSGTASGKDFVSACACLCFFYLTPKFDNIGRMVENIKVAMTAPTAQ